MVEKSEVSEKRVEDAKARVTISAKVSDQEVGTAVLRFLLSIGGQDECFPRQPKPSA